jgi:UDP-N-acetylglucosamine pyrophosphorylase
MKKRGIEHISYWQVDNPNIHVLDPVFIGLHATAEDSSGEMSGKMLAKAEPKEKVGVFCRSTVNGEPGRWSSSIPTCPMRWRRRPTRTGR